MKHAVWDLWGFPGAGDTTVYLVYDPDNSLASGGGRRGGGKFAGIPCPVASVRRLADHWYAAEFYTEESWGRCDSGSARHAKTP